MRRITIIYRDGTREDFHERGRAGGSYTLSLKQEHGYTTIVDEWDNTTSIPTELIQRVETEAGR